VTDHHKLIGRIPRWIKAHGLKEVSFQDVRREALSGSLDAEQTQLVDRMESAGWLGCERI
jgi:hypothetical protein